MESITRYGNGVQTRFEVPGSLTKTVFVSGILATQASSDFQSVTLTVAPGVGVPVEIDYSTVSNPVPPANYNPAAVVITGGTGDGLQRIGLSTTPGVASDVFISRDAANTLAQRNGTAAQAFNLYNTYTDASNYERGVFDWTSAANTLTIGTKALGTGVVRTMEFAIGGTSQLVLGGNIFRPTSVGGVSLGASNTGFSKIYLDYINTATIGAVTINKAAGRVNIAAAGTSIVVTNSFVTAASKVFAQVSQADATAYIKNVIPAAGSFTVTLGAAATAQTSVDFFVVSAD